LTVKKSYDTLKTMKIPTILPYTGAKDLGEIYQSMELKIALLKKDGDKFKTQTPFVNCYDFIVDSYSASLEKYSFSVYGFRWDGTKKSPDWSGIYLHLRFPNEHAKKNYLEHLHFLHEIEKNNKIPLTAFTEIDDLNGLVVGNKAWLKNCLILRLYTFLQRMMCYDIKTKDWIKELGAQSHSDSNYIKNLNRESWDRILKDLSSIHTDYFCGLSFNKDGTSAVHHNSGFFSTFSNHTEMNQNTVRNGRHWQDMKQRGFKLYTK